MSPAFTVSVAMSDMKPALGEPMLRSRIVWIMKDARQRQATADYLHKRDNDLFAEGRAQAWGEVANLLYAALNMPADVEPSELEKQHA